MNATVLMLIVYLCGLSLAWAWSKYKTKRVLLSGVVFGYGFLLGWGDIRGWSGYMMVSISCIFVAAYLFVSWLQYRDSRKAVPKQSNIAK